jgi:hypothetical protein
VAAEPVKAVFALATALDQARLSQHRQVVADRRLALSGRQAELPDVHFGLAPQSTDNGQPVLISQQFQQARQSAHLVTGYRFGHLLKGWRRPA